MSLKILQIVPSISLVYGGPSQMVRGFSAALARQGVDLTILTTDANGDRGQPPLNVPLDRPVSQQGYQVRYFRCSPFRRYKFSIDLLRWLWQHAPEYDLAHIHALFSPVSSAAAWVARQRNLPYILRPLGTLDPADLQKKKQLKQIYAAFLEKGNITGAAALHFTAPREAEISHRFGAQTRDLVIPLGVTPPTKSEIDPLDILKSHLPDLKYDRPWILFLSRIEPKKGLDLLIPALEKLLSQGLEFQFILAGSNPQDPEYEARIQQQIAASPLIEQTAIAGFVTGELKSALLQRADLFVLPSYYENFGIAVAEAMVSGTAVAISDRVHICDEVSQSESGWVGSCDVESVARTIESALENPAECQRRGTNAQAYAIEHYSWDAIAQETLRAYQSILEPQKSQC
ncbi:MAG: hormogonium polysaccharide biosynthesis glycosyltransferase HpsP [Cyanobacteriota bacterium]|nr:hormogonium polysaccharide biosynthesis glycosyltransferase HpsP [Cyanobacteriota bacterium]